MKIKYKALSAILLILTAITVALTVAKLLGTFPSRIYYGEDFGIARLASPVDFNGNGTDDYADFLLGARKDAENRPTYDGSYQAGGYPPDNIGVCADVIWRAFKNAGYSLRDMIDADISSRPSAYPLVTHPDKNIDFRRVRNLRIFFEEYAITLTLDSSDIAEWQAGDIVIFGDDKHIGIISDKRNRRGVAYVIHNAGQAKREEDCLERYEITGHYRFDASALPPDILIAWQENE